MYFSFQLFYLLFGTFLYFLSLWWTFHCVHQFFSQISWASLMTITLNSLSGRPPIFIPLRSFSEVLFFHLEHISLFLYFSWLSVFAFYVLDKTATFFSLVGVALFRRWPFTFSIALGCLLNLYDCLNYLIYTWHTSIVEGVPRPVSDPREGISFST